MKKLLCLIVMTAMAVTGCQQPDYSVVYADKVTEYVEVETVVYVEDTGDPDIVYVEVEDTGWNDEIWVENFTQPKGADGVDILWIIDTSGSMNRYDPQLIAGIEAMMNALPESGWRLAMLSNDPSKAVTESQFPLVPGDDIDDALDMYSLMARGGMEEGFDAAYEYIVNNPYAATWMRSDAALLVVFVSDEEEQSNDHFPLVSDFTAWYSTQRMGSAYLASINNVEQIDSVCTSGPSPIDIGHRYMEATNYFGGTVVDICSEDWSPGVTDASVQVEPHEEWPLAYDPKPNSIEVFLNGVPSTDWVYDSVENKVVFTVIPSGGVLVEIAYALL
tara:strand:+ start:2744 stop:3739 length:996 start_codon:yes stop_codon:yes gene_type:complete